MSKPTATTLSGYSRTHHTHCYQAGYPQIARHLMFRDDLRAHRDEAQGYGRLKQALASRFPHDLATYSRGKEAFVLAIQGRASEWSHSHRETVAGAKSGRTPDQAEPRSPAKPET